MLKCAGWLWDRVRAGNVRWRRGRGPERANHTAATLLKNRRADPAKQNRMQRRCGGPLHMECQGESGSGSRNEIPNRTLFPTWIRTGGPCAGSTDAPQESIALRGPCKPWRPGRRETSAHRPRQLYEGSPSAQFNSKRRLCYGFRPIHGIFTFS